MGELLAEIRSRGYWRVVVRPGTFLRDRLEYSSLLPVMSGTSVRIRGWDFPHVGSEDELEHGGDYVAVRVKWSSYREYWRFYQSGQLIYLGGIHGDWLDHSAWGNPATEWEAGGELGVEDVVYRFTEVFELAKRLSLSEAGYDSMHVAVEMHGLSGRTLVVSPRRAGFMNPRAADINEFLQEGDFEREVLVSGAWELAQGWASEVFQRFGWTPEAGVLGSFQDELRARRGG